MSESQQLLRQWKILQLLADSKPGCTIQELAAACEVSMRSVQRDLAVLQTAGFPLEHVTVSRIGMLNYAKSPLSVITR